MNFSYDIFLPIRKIDNSWLSFFHSETNEEYFIDLRNKILKACQNKNCVPAINNVFKVYEIVPIEKIRVVILGQDPYPQKNYADGLAFSSQQKKTPASLRNILKQISYEFSKCSLKNNNLKPWAKQGVFLLNSSLTTFIEKANSHKKMMWSIFIEKTLLKINESVKNCIYLLMGKDAQKLFQNLKINDTKNIIRTSHPSPFSFHQDFFGKNVFRKINKLLKEKKLMQIVW